MGTAPGWWQDSSGQWFPPEQVSGEQDKAESNDLAPTTNGSEQASREKGEFGLALKAAFQAMNGTIKTAGRVGWRGAFVQGRLSNADGKFVTESRILDLVVSEAWLTKQLKDGFEGFLMFACLTGSKHDVDSTLIVEAVETETRALVELRLPMRRMRMGKLKAMKDSANVERWETLII
jgi:hypothetical protein